MTPDVRHHIWLLRETIAIILTIIALRLHIVTVTVEERYALKQRRDRLREQIAEIRGRES